ncbi:MAG: rRNA maturation RNase YbeY [Balneola sp.]|nr:MAG: rRNA maturation RNase YbeY [Balneola sp.]
MEESASILQLFNEHDFALPFSEIEAEKLLEIISKDQKVTFSFVEVAYVDEKEIIKVNQEFLSKDYVTDIISFRYDEDETNQSIEGTLYCCAPRIEEQTSEFGESTKREFLRVLVHGLIHLIGFDDQTETEKAEMTRLEDKYLDLFYKSY